MPSTNLKRLLKNNGKKIIKVIENIGVEWAKVSVWLIFVTSLEPMYEMVQ